MTPAPEKSYRVYVERHLGGWIVVTAPDEAIARSRAQVIADKDCWSPERQHTSTSVVEEIPDVA